MYHYLNTKCGLFFIALAPSYLCSIHISFSFYCAGSLLFPSHSFCSVFLYAFIISHCPCISQSLFIWVKKSYFQSFYFLVLHNSQFPLLVSFFPLVLLDSPHFTSLQLEALLFSRIPGFLCFLQQLTLLLLLIIDSSASFQWNVWAFFPKWWNFEILFWASFKCN